MKALQQLRINAIEYPVIDRDVRLSLNQTGSASFRVQTDEVFIPNKTLVDFELGWSETGTRLGFSGVLIHQSHVSAHEQILFCREFPVALKKATPLALRHATLPMVLEAIGQQSGLKLVCDPTADYSTTVVPYFYHTGNGLLAMASLQPVFSIEQFFWQQTTEGTIWVGDWRYSEWPEKTIDIPDDLFTKHQSNNSATIPVVPGLKPGVQCNRGIINQVTIKTDHTMEITWQNSFDD